MELWPTFPLAVPYTLFNTVDLITAQAPTTANPRKLCSNQVWDLSVFAKLRLFHKTLLRVEGCN